MMRVALAGLFLLLLPRGAAAAAPQEHIAAMRAAWSALTSYRTSQTIQERMDGEMGPEQRMRVAFRKPWEIQLTWETVHPGRKAYWSETRKDGEVLIYPGGMAGRALGILSFSPDNPILRRDTTHSLAEAGFGFLAEKIGRLFAGSASSGALTLARDGAIVSGEPAWVVAISNVTGLGYGRAELSISQRTHLPVAFVGWETDGTTVKERFAWAATEVDAAIDERADFDVAYR